MSRSRLLRRALLANATFSTLTGGAALLASAPIAGWMGLADPRWLVALGPGLLVFAASLVFTATRPEVDERQALMFSLGDMGWVLGSAALLVLLPDAFNTMGTMLVVDVALVVGLLGAAQLLGLSRLRAGRQLAA